ncbi:BRO family protein [Orbaceae bacterium ac157xtp]
MTSLSIFQFHENSLNTLINNNEVWFLANDICKILDFKNPRTAVSNHCKPWGVLKQDTPTSSGIQAMIYINEPNLYRLIVKSRKPEAEEFERKVFEDILPTIRKTGSYTLTISTEQQQMIKRAVQERSYRTGEHYQAIYTKFYEYFKIPRYQDLPAIKFEEAMKWLGGVQPNYKAINLDNLKRQYNYLASIQECYYRIFDEYNDNLAGFLSKNSPHLHYNISTALNKMQVTLGLSLNYNREEIKLFSKLVH